MITGSRTATTVPLISISATAPTRTASPYHSRRLARSSDMSVTNGAGVLIRAGLLTSFVAT